MIKLDALTCPRCGADVPVPPEDAVSVRCPFCGHTSQVERPVAAPAAPPPYRGSYEPERPITPATSSTAVVVVLAVLGPVLLALLIMGLVVMSRNGAKNFHWRDVPVPVAVDGDSVEDVVGLITAMDEKGYPTYLAAFNGATSARLWRAGPYGKYEVQFAVVGSWAVAIDESNVVHILALRTGVETARLTLTDKVKASCAPAGESGTFWIETTDEKAVSIDLATQASRPSPHPGSCPDRRSNGCDHMGSAGTACSDPKNAPRVAGFGAMAVLTRGADAVAVGTKTPGSRTPIAVGFDPDTRNVRWQKPLLGSPTSAFVDELHAVDMGEGKLVAEYVSKTAKQSARLMALDPRTGATLWDVAVPNTDSVPEAKDVLVTATRVYLPHWVSLDVFDLGTGQHLATFGQ